MTSTADPTERPLRRDAERNRRRILRAAAEVFSERGLDATLDDVARRAGVGVGTVYRRFPDKETLVGELFQDRIDAMERAAEEACRAPDPWTGLVTYLEQVAAMMAGDQGLRQMLLFATYGKDRVAYARERMRPVVARLVARAQEAGQLREDFRPTDVPIIAAMLATAAEYSAPVQPAAWRRYLTLVIDGLRPARDGTSPLPVPALTPEEIEQLMRAHSQASRRALSRAYARALAPRTCTGRNALALDARIGMHVQLSVNGGRAFARTRIRLPHGVPVTVHFPSSGRSQRTPEGAGHIALGMSRITVESAETCVRNRGRIPFVSQPREFTSPKASPTLLRPREIPVHDNRQRRANGDPRR